MTQKTNLEVLFDAYTGDSYRQLEKAKKEYELGLKQFITSHLISDLDFEEVYQDEWQMLRDAYIGDPYIEGYEVLASIVYSHIAEIEEEVEDDLPIEVLTV